MNRSLQKTLLILLILNGATPAFGEERQPLGIFRNTEYYLSEEAPFANHPKNADVLDVEGRVLARVNSEYKRLLDIEGSGILIDGRVITYAARHSDGIRYMESPIPGYGMTTLLCAAVPFKTIAVDRTVIPLGSVVHIQETEGMVLPDGTRHDGDWVATDTGSAIQRDRIDLFVGKKSDIRFLTRHGIRDLMPLHLSLVSPFNPENPCVIRLPGQNP